MTFQIPGEWWITAEGALPADGGNESNEPHHSETVAEKLWLELVDTLRDKFPIILLGDTAECGYESFAAMGADSASLRAYFCDVADQLHRAGRLTDEEADDIYDTVCQRTGWGRKKLDLLVDTDNQELLIEHGLREYGWIRLHGNSAQFWAITPSSVRRFAQNLPEIGPDGFVPDDTLFLLESCTGRAVFTDVPLTALNDCRQSLSPLLPYRRIYGEPIKS